MLFCSKKKNLQFGIKQSIKIFNPLEDLLVKIILPNNNSQKKI